MRNTARVLVVARQTAASDDLVEALRRRAERGPIAVTLLMPAVAGGLAGRDATRPMLEAAAGRLRDAGIDVVEALVGASEPLDAVIETAQPGRFDEAVVATLPGSSSKWLQADLPRRVARAADLLVTHVEARPSGEVRHRTSPAHRHEPEPLGPLAVLGWAGSRH